MLHIYIFSLQKYKNAEQIFAEYGKNLNPYGFTQR